ncbi:MAG: phosphoenolpyruvate-utilizing N-terminal domain-containing protein, partial [Lachnospira sp.]|nr:phosphoenolpyruvate-utilizing N-terminal domain-containing protein [Lachnospira sp.]
MDKYTGKSVFGGVAIGKILLYEKGEHQVKRVKISDTDAQKKRYYDAVKTATEELAKL